MPLMTWATRVLQWLVQRDARSRDGANLIKTNLSSDCSLQLDYMKLESLVIVNQNVTVNTFSSLVHTARHTMRVCNAQNRWPNQQWREPSKVGQMIGVKS